MFSRASFSFDILIIALGIIVPMLLYSIYIVKKKKDYILHKRLQILISLILFTAILIFEVDIRIRGWVHLAKDSPYYETILWPVLYIHLFCAVSATILWIIVLWRALIKFPKMPQPNEHSSFHKKLAPWAVSGLILTTITGITFYYIAFV